jgi:hypothetical protein
VGLSTAEERKSLQKQENLLIATVEKEAFRIFGRGLGLWVHSREALDLSINDNLAASHMKPS